MYGMAFSWTARISWKIVYYVSYHDAVHTFPDYLRLRFTLQAQMKCSTLTTLFVCQQGLTQILWDLENDFNGYC